jgi:4-hydroxy-tetrahydrodipicolinate reductase
MTIRVGVFGAGGRMGATVCDAVAAESDLELVAAVDPAHAGTSRAGVAIGDDADAMADTGVEVAVDFTVLDAARHNARWCAEHGVHAVVGTTGWSAADLDELRAVFTTSNCVVAPNFAVGAVLMMRFAELAAPFFETVEVIELHHDAKADAPSGTAMLTVERIASASNRWAADPTRVELVPGARGGISTAGIRVHSVRLRGLVAHQEVLLGTTGQTLTVRHDSYDRASFMPGVLLAVRQVAARTGVTVGLDALLGL